jgi:LPS sulfotransferase NodH
MTRSLSFVALKTALHASEAIGLRPRALKAGTLLQKARTQTSLTDFGDMYFLDSLERLVQSANAEARLNPYGRLMLEKLILQYLANRLMLQKARSEQPGVFGADIIPPVIVTGQPRTGTTNLHRLLAAAPGARALQYWELMHPFPMKGAESRSERVALADRMLKLRRRLTPELDATHYIRPDSPEECMFMLGLTFHSRIFWNVASVHSWLEWYNAADRAGKYRDYADMLRWYQAQYPGERLVLKAPDHVDGIGALLDAVPEAMIIQTHRDPVAQFGSYLSLGEQTRRIAARTPQRDADTRSSIAMTRSANLRNSAARRKYPGRVIDVEYNRLVSNPLETVAMIYRTLGLDFGKEHEKAVAAHARRNRKGKHGLHSYSLADFGLTDQSVRQQLPDTMYG